MKNRAIWVWFLLLGLWVNAAWAQTSNQGAIVGTVTDATGGVTPGVTIMVRNVATGVPRTAITDDLGNYLFGFLVPGEYSVTAELSGFKKKEITGILVRVGERPRVDVKLEVGEVTETVTVTSSAPALNTENPTLGEVIPSGILDNLPFFNREFIAVAALAPGAYNSLGGRGQVGSRGFAIGVNGLRTALNSFTLDGADNSTGNHALAASPPIPAIQEVRIETSNYPVHTGRSGAAVIQVVTKSGTNSIHGSLYNYHRNKALDALPWLFCRPGETHEACRGRSANYLFNNFGAAVGGPIVKNKTFIFGTADFHRQIQPGSLITGFSPNDRERKGDFTQTINWFTQRPTQLRNPFTGTDIASNIIPPELINPVGRRFMEEAWPKPNFDDPFFNLRLFAGGRFTMNKYLIRADHHFSDKDLVFGTFLFENSDSLRERFSKYSDSASKIHTRTMSGTYTRVFTPGLVNNLVVSYLYADFVSTPALGDKNYGQEFGFSTKVHKANTMPAMYMYGPILAMNIGGFGISDEQTRTFYLKDHLTWVKGRHSLTLGGDFRRQGHLFKSWGGMAGYYFGFLDGVPNSGLHIAGELSAALLMGVPWGYDSYYGEDRLLPLRRLSLSGFVGDTWKVTPRLTLDLGLRYDYEEPFTITDGRFMTLNWATGLPRYCKDAPASELATLKYRYETGGPCRPYEPNKLSFAPRLGFAFRPFNNNSTVVRGGYGVFFIGPKASVTRQGAYVAPFAGWAGTTVPFARNWPDKKDHFFTLDQEPYGVDIVQGTFPGNGFFGTTPKYPESYTQHFHLTIGRALGFETSMELAYVGTRGVKLSSVIDLRVTDPSVLPKVFANTPKWASARSVYSKDFNSYYHGMQLRFRKDESHGLSFLAHYTWSKAMTDAAYDEGTLQSIIEDDASGVTRLLRQNSLADYDVRHRLVFTGTWQLPFGRGKRLGANWHPFLNTTLGGWRLTPIYTLSSGFPWGVQTTLGRRPNRVCNGNLPRSQRTISRWYDFTCFVDNPPVQVVDPLTGRTVNRFFHGNAPSNIITGPGTKKLDLGIHKGFYPVPGRESLFLTFRAEFLNAFNTPQLIGPAAVVYFNTAPGARITRAGDQRSVQLALTLNF